MSRIDTSARPPALADEPTAAIPVVSGAARRTDGPAPGTPGRRRWERPRLAVLLVATAVLHLWNLASSGYANSFYAAAVQAGTQNWTAFFFGSLDSGNAITVDKPPASLWVMALSGRIFGLSSWSMLAPQALMGVAAVALLYAAVCRVAGPGAGLLAGTALALTPVAVLMFRFDNPDALLVLLLVAVAYCVTRAVERPGPRWMVLAGLLLGFAFLTKMLQAFLVVPGLAAAYLWAAPTGLGRRIRDVVLGGAGIVVGAGWWLLAVALWPAGSRPYIGGSTNNTPLELAFGYNGLGRIFGQGGPGGGAPAGPSPDAGAGLPRAMGEAGAGFPGGGPGGNGGFGGQAGLGRMFNSAFGTQVSWLLPAALVLGVVAFLLVRRAPRTDRLRAALVLWGGWTLVTALTFSFMSGTIHPYYTVALAPGVAALAGIGAVRAWRVRDTWAGRGTLTAVTAVTAAWAFVLLGRAPQFLPWLRWVVLVVGLLAAVGFLLLGRVRVRAVAVGVAVAALVSGLAGPAAYAIQTAGTAHTGSIPTAGPAVEGGGFGPGGQDGRGGLAWRDRGTTDGTRDGTAALPGASFGPDGTGGSGGPGGMGGPGETGRVDAALGTLLKDAGTRWAAATSGSQSAASLELASGTAVMAMGGFVGSDPYPSPDQFKAYVANGEIHYYITDGGTGGRPGHGATSEITAWVEQNFTSTTVGGHTVYDLTAPRR